ncbi:MAG: histidine--tRNA ligase [Rickettsiales bacterium]|jgi:histidyl-tRNA synthetase|nr:histidine--tRNA ligase [Rickettsiales bacterium]
MMNLQPVRGTKDVFGRDMEKYNFIVSTAKKVSNLYNFVEIMTPIFEFSEVFEKNLGDTTDVVLNEIYKFKDKSDTYLSLRPEFTAGVVRALNNHSELNERLPIKLFSHGPIFRYDRPQMGRQRQFSQVNFEYFGIGVYMGDVDIILLCDRFLNSLGLDNVNLEINSLGSAESRKNFETSLGAYLEKYRDELSGDSKIRLEKNILRILDSKDEKDKKILEGAPKISDHYTEEDRRFFSDILEKLAHVGIKYRVDEFLVRGLDYYTSTVFEYTTDKIGSKSAVMGGGRYDNLVGQMGGRSMPAVGCAAGVERLMLLLEDRAQEIEPISIVPISGEELSYCLELVENLRGLGVVCELNSQGNIAKKMNQANRNKSKYAVIVGADEVRDSLLTVKEMSTGIESKISFTELLPKLPRI